MTSEEAITRLKNMAWLYGSAEREQNIEAIDMAIEALSADTSSDLISRADAIEAFDRGRVYHKSGIEEIINALPSAELPKGDLISRQWLLEVYGDYIGDNGEPKYYVPLEVVRQNIKDAPSADALLIQEIDFHKKVSRIEAEKVVDLEHKLADMVSVVRCKDCRHRGLFSCPLADNDFQKDEDFCSWGERKEK